jgi:hypothetical protein
MPSDFSTGQIAQAGGSMSKVLLSCRSLGFASACALPAPIVSISKKDQKSDREGVDAERTKGY